MPVFIEYSVAALILLSGLFTLAGSIGLLKLPDLFTRLHAPTLSVTLGVGFLIVATLIWFSFKEHDLATDELIITLLLIFSAPVSAHMIGKAALHQRVELTENTQNKALAEKAAEQVGPTDSKPADETH